MTQESVFRRFKESLQRLNRGEESEDELYPGPGRATQEAIRRLSRTRVSSLLRQLRAAHGLSYADVQLSTGLSQQLLFDVEFGERRLTVDELRLLATYYQVSVNDILGVTLDPE